MNSLRFILFSVISVFAFALSTQSYAEQKEKPDRKELVQMHQEMAKRHNEAAKCIKAGRSIDECNQQAMKNCPMMKSGNCPFMGDGMGMMEHGGMMDHDNMPMGDQRQNKGGKSQ